MRPITRSQPPPSSAPPHPPPVDEEESSTPLPLPTHSSTASLSEKGLDDDDVDRDAVDGVANSLVEVVVQPPSVDEELEDVDEDADLRIDLQEKKKEKKLTKKQLKEKAKKEKKKREEEEKRRKKEEKLLREEEKKREKEEKKKAKKNKGRRKEEEEEGTMNAFGMEGEMKEVGVEEGEGANVEETVDEQKQHWNAEGDYSHREEIDLGIILLQRANNSAKILATPRYHFFIVVLEL